MNRSISIVIPNYNGERLLADYVPSVIAACQHYQGETELLVVDDCSTDASLSVLAGFGAAVRVIQQEENQGFSGTCNRGITESQHDLVFLLNSDVRLAEDYLDYMSEHFDDPACFAVTPNGRRVANDEPLDACLMMKWRGGSLRHGIMYFEEDLQKKGLQAPYKSGRVQGAYFVADRAKLRELGGFDMIYSPFYWEETDLSYRALKRGWHIVFEPRAVAWHEVGTSIGTKTIPLKKRSIMKRNRIYFHVINIRSRWRLLHFFTMTLVNMLLLRRELWLAVGMAWRQRSEVLACRRREQAAATVSDHQVMASMRTFFK